MGGAESECNSEPVHAYAVLRNAVLRRKRDEA